MGGEVDDADDVVAAARYLAARPEVDGTRINVLGTSRGAFTALLALERQPGLWRRGVLLMGLYDPAVFLAAERTRPRTLLPSSAEIDLADLEEYFASPRRQPLTALGDVTAPLLILHGEADPIVPLAESEDLATRVSGSGRRAHLITVPGLGHDSDHEDAVWADLWPEIGRFLTGGGR
jgi:dipeptidyl aminopeptidase/acylaminoacyl peptidase